MRRLETFDLVGPTICMRELLQAWGRVLGWADNHTRLDLALRAALRLKPHGVSTRGALYKEAHTYSYRTLNASSRATLYESSRCDYNLYAHMLSTLRPAAGVALPALSAYAWGATAAAESLQTFGTANTFKSTVVLSKTLKAQTSDCIRLGSLKDIISPEFLSICAPAT